MKTFEVEKNVGVADKDDQLLDETEDECIHGKDTGNYFEAVLSKNALGYNVVVTLTHIIFYLSFHLSDILLSGVPSGVLSGVVA